MLKAIVWIIIVGSVCYGGLCGLLYVMQRSMLYYPTPAIAGVSGAKHFWLESDGQRLKIWHVPGSSQRALLYFGGNAEDVSGNISQFKRMFPELTLYLMNYRGYGGSSGRPAESSLKKDALKLLDLALERHGSAAVMGRSLGTGIAVYLAAQRELSHLVLVTPYDSMLNLASHHYPYVPVSLLLKDRYDSQASVSSLRTPTLALIAEHDEVIPRKSSDALLEAFASEIIEARIISGAGHNTIGSQPEYERLIQAFVHGPAGPPL